MGDMGDDFRAFREAKRERDYKRYLRNYSAITEACEELGLSYTNQPERAAFRVEVGGTMFDLYPKSQKYCILGKNTWGRFGNAREFLAARAKATPNAE
jgi:hypothetical protein